jgi:hypothetical protein
MEINNAVIVVPIEAPIKIYTAVPRFKRLFPAKAAVIEPIAPEL